MEYRISKQFKWGLIDFVNQWAQLKGKYNCIEFDLIKVFFENDKRFATFDTEIYLLGFGLRVCITYNKKKNKKECLKLLSKSEKTNVWVKL